MVSVKSSEDNIGGSFDDFSFNRSFSVALRSVKNHSSSPPNVSVAEVNIIRAISEFVNVCPWLSLSSKWYSFF